MINRFAEEMMKQIDGICYNAEAEGWSAIVEETDTKKCAIDRNKLIVLINERCFRDKNKEKPFEKWTRFIEEGTNGIKECSNILCLCGQDIMYHYIYYRDTVRIIIGSQCVKTFDGMTERIKEENEKLKTCVKCGKGKSYKGTLCAKCIANEIREKKNNIVEPTTPLSYISKCSKLIDRYPHNTLYKSLLSQVKSLSNQQEELIDSEFNFNFM